MGPKMRICTVARLSLPPADGGLASEQLLAEPQTSDRCDEEIQNSLKHLIVVVKKPNMRS